jgi:hypothetical protein
VLGSLLTCVYRPGSNKALPTINDKDIKKENCKATKRQHIAYHINDLIVATNQAIES